MNFWETVAGNRLASILSSELPELNDNLRKIGDTKEIVEKLDIIINKMDRIETRLNMLESEYADTNGYEVCDKEPDMEEILK